MARKLYSNNSSTTLAAPISSSATSLSVVSGGGALFPTLTGSQTFTATLVSASNSTIREIVLVTSSPLADNFNITRAQEGTTALNWSAGDSFNLLNTAGDMSAMQQAPDLQAQATNYALDTGSANAYIANFTPAITAHVAGAPLRVKIANTNTSTTVTFNDGAGAGSVYLPGGATVPVGGLLANAIAEFCWDGSGFQLLNQPTNTSGIEQTVSNLVLPVGSYLMVENDSFNPNSVLTWQTWTEVQGYVLVGRNPSDPNFASTGTTGGADTQTLVAAQVPPLSYRDAYFCEDGNYIHPQPGDNTIFIGSLNHSIGSGKTDFNNNTVWFRYDNTLSGNGLSGTKPALPFSVLQPYRVVRMWRRTA